MKKAIIIIIVLVVSIIIGVLALLTALRLKTQESIAPTAPKVKPRAEEPTPPLSNVCTVTFTLATPTPGPSATPTLTPTQTPSPTPKDNVPPKCTSLSASPISGDAPLLVTFVASGYDNNEGYVAGFDFTFGDGETKKIEQTFNTNDSYTITHSYGKVGTYIASVRIKDNNGAWSDVPDACKQTITVKGAGVTSTPPPVGQPEPSVTPTTPTPSPVAFVPSPTEVAAIPQVPQAGNFIPTILTIVGGAIILAVGVLAL
ncbi:PKD domain-containing protein [Candidatus Gottesmanbacteria bacterium]|nr:PKD domain-containing protein [Candidatus Gottesmanbacteria bacterium]